MADVTFGGLARGAPARNIEVQLVPGNVIPSAEVEETGLRRGQPARNTEVQLVSNPFVSQADVEYLGQATLIGQPSTDRQVEIYSQPLPVTDVTYEIATGAPPPWSKDPDQVDFVCFPTGPADVANPAVNNLIQIFLSNAANVVASKPPHPYLTEIGNLVGTEIFGLGPTGGGTTGIGRTPLWGYQGKITAFTDGSITVSPTMPGLPTNIDQIYLDIARVARKSPRIEIILS